MHIKYGLNAGVLLAEIRDYFCEGVPKNWKCRDNIRYLVLLTPHTCPINHGLYCSQLLDVNIIVVLCR